QTEPLLVAEEQHAAPLDHQAPGREVERHDRNVLALDVAPDVERGPVRQREDADALAGIEAAVIEMPQLGPLAARIPAMGGAAQGEDPLLGARRLLVAACPAARSGAAVGGE